MCCVHMPDGYIYEQVTTHACVACTCLTGITCEQVPRLREDIQLPDYCALSTAEDEQPTEAQAEEVAIPRVVSVAVVSVAMVSVAMVRRAMVSRIIVSVAMVRVAWPWLAWP